MTSSKPLRVLALMHEKLVPPEDVADVDVAEVEWKTEFDVVETLRDLGHEVLCLGLLSDPRVIGAAIDDFEPDIAFNLAEEFDGVASFDQNVVACLELFGLPYTGCNPKGLMLARDKALSKRILSHRGLPVPRFAVIREGRKARRPKGLEFPLIVKTRAHEGSLGIAQASVVEDDAKLAERVAFVHEQFHTDAIVESYIAGRELYVGVLGNDRPELLPTWELHFDSMPEGDHRIATRRVKWDGAYQKRVGVRTAAAGLDAETEARVARAARRVYRWLGLSGYARLDFRLSADGQPYFLEANPNPQIAYGEDFAESAESGGIPYENLLDRILRYGLAWKPDRLG